MTAPRFLEKTPRRMWKVLGVASRGLALLAVAVFALAFLRAGFAPTLDVSRTYFAASTGQPSAVALPDARAEVLLVGIPENTRGLELAFSFRRTTPRVEAQLVDTADASCVWSVSDQGRVRVGGLVAFGVPADSRCLLGTRSLEVVLNSASFVGGPTPLASLLVSRGVARPEVPGVRLVSPQLSGPSLSGDAHVQAQVQAQVHAHVHAFVRTASTLPSQGRFALLGYHWTGKYLESASGFRLVMVALVAFLFAGTALTLFAPKGRSRVTGGLSAGLLLSGFLGLWIVGTPPLQAPDEPDHLLSGFRLSAPAHEISALDEALASEARRVHFERLKFHSDESFSVGDVSASHPTAWSAHVAPFDLVGRSALESALFRFLPPSLQGGPVFGYLLDLRLLMGLWVLACALACGLCLTSMTPEETPAGFQAAFLLFALLPALPQFAVHVSNYGFLIGSLVVLLGATAVRPRTERQGILKFALIGLSLAFCCLSGRVGLTALILLPLATVWMPVVSWVSPWKVWTVAFSAFAAPVLFAKPHSFAFLGQGFANIAAWVPGLPPNVIFLIPVFLACVLLATLDAFVFAREHSLSSKTHYDVSGTPRMRDPRDTRAFLALGAVLLLVLVVPYFFALAPLAENERAGSLLGVSYALEVLPRFVRGLGISDPDFFLTTSFWSGFGWLDTIFSNRLVRVLKCIPVAVALLAVAGWVFRSDGRRPALFLATAWVLGLSIVCVQAYAISYETVNLHGRALAPAYMVLVAGGLLPLSMGRANRELDFLPTRLLVAVAVCLQLHSLRFVLERIFS